MVFAYSTWFGRMGGLIEQNADKYGDSKEEDTNATTDHLYKSDADKLELVSHTAVTMNDR